MKFTDQEIVSASERDQNDANVKEIAADVALFYRELAKGGVPEDVAKVVTQAFAAMVVFAGCSCPLGED